MLDTEGSGAKHRVSTSDDHIGAGGGAGQPGHGDVGPAAGGQHGARQLEGDQGQRRPGLMLQHVGGSGEQILKQNTLSSLSLFIK